MEDELSVAFALAKALIAGRDLSELSRLQIILQALSCMISTEIGCRRLKGSAQAKGGASE